MRGNRRRHERKPGACFSLTARRGTIPECGAAAGRPRAIERTHGRSRRRFVLLARTNPLPRKQCDKMTPCDNCPELGAVTPLLPAAALRQPEAYRRLPVPWKQVESRGIDIPLFGTDPDRVRPESQHGGHLRDASRHRDFTRLLQVPKSHPRAQTAVRLVGPGAEPGSTRGPRASPTVRASMSSLLGCSVKGSANPLADLLRLLRGRSRPSAAHRVHHLPGRRIGFRSGARGVRSSSVLGRGHICPAHQLDRLGDSAHFRAAAAMKSVRPGAYPRNPQPVCRRPCVRLSDLSDSRNTS